MLRQRERKSGGEKQKRKMARIDMPSILIQPHLSFSKLLIPTSHNCPSLIPFFFSHSFYSLSPTFMGFFGFSHRLRVRPREDFNILRNPPSSFLTFCIFSIITLFCISFSLSLSAFSKTLSFILGLELISKFVR